ncbi:MAG: SPOR domain-containing protein [Candidatus Binatia bacterium]
MVVVRCGWVLSVSLLFAACSQTVLPPPPPNFVAWSHLSPVTPKRVCVLPFIDRTDTPGLADQVRRSFAGQLSVKHFIDVELYRIDDQLEAVGPDWRNLTVQQLGRTLGCEALIYGEVTKASRLYLALYSQLTLEGNIQMVETEAGQTLVHDAYATKFRSAGVPLSPLSIVPDAVKNLSNLSDEQMTRAVDDLSRHLAMRIPDLPDLESPQPAQFAQTPPPSSASAPIPEFMPATESASALSAPEEQIAQVGSSVYDVPPGMKEDQEPPPLPSANSGFTEPQTPTESEGYRLQIAAFSTRQGAERAIGLLRDKGYEPIITTSTGASPIWHRVTLGPFPSIHSAQEVGAEINKVLPFSPIVIYPRPH